VEIQWTAHHAQVSNCPSTGDGPNHSQRVEQRIQVATTVPLRPLSQKCASEILDSGGTSFLGVYAECCSRLGSLFIHGSQNDPSQHQDAKNK